MTYVHGTVFLTFLITKTSFDQFGVKRVSKILFLFWYSTVSPILSLGSLSLISLLELIYGVSFYATSFQFNCTMICIIIFINYII